MRYANIILSLTKESPAEPFKIQYKYLDEVDLQTRYLPDGKIWFPDMRRQNVNIQAVDNNLYDLLQHMLLSIQSYPWTWSLQGEKLDDYGYDLYDSGGELFLSPTALYQVQSRLLFVPDIILEKPYSQPKYVTAPHLTKFSLTFPKAHPLSELSIQFHSVQPVRLASLVYESDLSGFSEAIELDLETLQVSQSNENLTILFGRPILSRRLTFVLAQDNLLSSVGLVSLGSEDFEEPLDETDDDKIASWITRQANYLKEG